MKERVMGGAVGRSESIIWGYIGVRLGLASWDAIVDQI